ncbi:hypothetical protein DESC_180051 [Desulfosarcina cetonica]|nr:hypothetical protein DESC_180051 [Desulfosarcina cetonica]
MFTWCICLKRKTNASRPFDNLTPKPFNSHTCFNTRRHHASFSCNPQSSDSIQDAIELLDGIHPVHYHKQRRYLFHRSRYD